MKKTLFFFCIINAWVSLASAQDTIEVPNLVRLGLYTDFPKVAKTQWTLENENIYHAEFSIFKDKHLHTAKYDLQGNWIERSAEIEYWQLPNAAKDEMIKRFQTFKVISSLKLESRSQKPVFRAIIEKQQQGDALKETYSIDISDKGELLKTSEPQVVRANAE